MSVFDRVLAQEPAVRTLRRALESGRVHHAYRFEGPDGVGKELVAFALAQSLLCDRDGPIGCGECGACRRVVSFTGEEPHVPIHPDVILVQRGLYAPSTLGTTSKEVTGIGVPQVRRIVLERARFSPHEGRAMVFIVRDADQLTPQAANAMLKTLEEPPEKTHFVLLTSRPHRLLDTVLSRTLAIRFGPLPVDVIAGILQTEGHDPKAARLAQGSASRGIALSNPETLEARETFARRVLEAAEADDLVGALNLASEVKDRQSLRPLLIHLGQTLALRARDVVEDAPEQAERHARAHAEVTAALRALESNAQTALLLESMIARMRRA